MFSPTLSGVVECGNLWVMEMHGKEVLPASAVKRY